MYIKGLRVKDAAGNVMEWQAECPYCGIQTRVTVGDRGGIAGPRCNHYREFLPESLNIFSAFNFVQTDCLWSEDFDGNWWTACEEGFVFTDGGPTEHGMKFCCYCGKSLEAKPYQDDEQDATKERATENGIEQEIGEGDDEERDSTPH
jgi:hypothetical protein